MKKLLKEDVTSNKMNIYNYIKIKKYNNYILFFSKKKYFLEKKFKKNYFLDSYFLKFNSSNFSKFYNFMPFKFNKKLSENLLNSKSKHFFNNYKLPFYKCLNSKFYFFPVSKKYNGLGFYKNLQYLNFYNNCSFLTNNSNTNINISININYKLLNLIYFI